MSKKIKIPFNVPLITGLEVKYLTMVMRSKRFCGAGEFTEKCQSLLEKIIGCQKAYLTTSCTHALEMASLLIGIKPGDEVIMSSFTFVSTANPFLIQGAKIVFVDIDPQTMNINPDLIEPAITERTKAIVPMHYAGVSCKMEKIIYIARKYNLFVIEDAAQCIWSYDDDGNHIGLKGNISCFSFHETKNIHCGEGGLICINDQNLLEKAETIWEKGTNRRKFINGEVDKYTWVSRGSSYLPSELNAAFLYGQLENLSSITEKRRNLCLNYINSLSAVEIDKDEFIVDNLNLKNSNGHIFYIKTKHENERNMLLLGLRKQGIQATFHYIPLHSSPMGILAGRFVGVDKYVTRESNRLLRLPLYYTLRDQEFIIEQILNFYHENS